MQLKKWVYPEYYIGKSFDEYYVFLGQHRDSTYMEQSNFVVGLEAIGGENPPDVIVVRSSHWAVGWIEQIMIHESRKDILEKAGEILDTLTDYPILDDEHHSNLRYPEVMRTIDEIRQDIESELEHIKFIDECDGTNNYQRIIDSGYFEKGRWIKTKPVESRRWNISLTATDDEIYDYAESIVEF